MRGLNKVTLIGNLGNNPDYQQLEGNVGVAEFLLATIEAFKDKSGQMHSNTEWHTVILWRSLTELARNYLTKGSLVYIDVRWSATQKARYVADSPTYRLRTGLDLELAGKDEVAQIHPNLSHKPVGTSTIRGNATTKRI